MTPRKSFTSPLNRRSFLQRAGIGGAAALTSPLWPKILSAATPPIRHVIISCQENRSFDHYFGFAPQVQAGGYGPPAGYSQPDGNGRLDFPVRVHQPLDT